MLRSTAARFVPGRLTFQPVNRFHELLCTPVGVAFALCCAIGPAGEGVGTKTPKEAKDEATKIEEKVKKNERKTADDLTNQSIEELMEIKVSIVSHKEEEIQRVASAVHVVTGEDIRRSGMQTIPDVLRMVPGLEIASVAANRWAVASRGSNGIYANKLLVLMDGRSVYTPLYSGVYWDAHDALLDDIKQIEVIRGPGATVWGANAVNGVINVVTKSAKETQGGYVEAGVGTEERGFGAVRYGGKSTDEKIHYRVYGKYFDRDETVWEEDGRDAYDNWRVIRGGFRLTESPATMTM